MGALNPSQKELEKEGHLKDGGPCKDSIHGRLEIVKLDQCLDKSVGECWFYVWPVT